MKNIFLFSALLATTLVITEPTIAAPMDAAQTAHVLKQGRLAGSLFTPVALGLGEQWELSTMLVPWFVLSPNIAVRKELGYLGKDIVVTGDYGVSIPTGAMRVTQGYLFPTWETSGQRPGWVVTPSLGVWISGGSRNVWTGRLETTLGLPLGDNPATPLESYAPLELLFAPALTGFRTRLGLAYDYAIADWLRARGALSGYVIGKSPYPPKSPFYMSAEVGVEIALGSVFRIGLGGIWYNSDQREKKIVKDADGRATRIATRSNDFFPTFDLILRPR